MNQESRANLLPEKDQNPDEGRHQTGVSKEMDITNLDSFSTNPSSKTGRAPMSSKTGIGSWSERELVKEQLILHSSGETDETETLKLGDSQSPPLLLYEQSVQIFNNGAQVGSQRRGLFDSIDDDESSFGREDPRDFRVFGETGSEVSDIQIPQDSTDHRLLENQSRMAQRMKEEEGQKINPDT